jgi:hypothetical protein
MGITNWNQLNKKNDMNLSKGHIGVLGSWKGEMRVDMITIHCIPVLIFESIF